MEGNKRDTEDSVHYSLLVFVSGIPRAESLPTQLFPQSDFDVNGAPLPAYASEMNGSISLSAIYSANSVMRGECILCAFPVCIPNTERI